MHINSPTIMHTGTRLLHIKLLNGRRKDFNPEQHDFINLPPGCEEEDKDCLLIGHLLPETMEQFAITFEKYPTVTCLRHPARVLESFRRRDRSFDSYCQQWDYMINEVANAKPLYICVDNLGIRDRQLEKISKLIGKEIKTDWPIVGEKGTHDIELTPELLEDVPKAYIEFYEDIASGDS